MNLIKEKQKLKSQIDQIEDEAFIKLLKELLSYAQNKRHSIPFTLAEYNQKLEEAEVDYKKGNVKKHKDVLKEVESWKQKVKK